MIYSTKFVKTSSEALKAYQIIGWNETASRNQDTGIPQAIDDAKASHIIGQSSCSCREKNKGQNGLVSQSVKLGSMWKSGWWNRWFFLRRNRKRAREPKKSWNVFWSFASTMITARVPSGSAIFEPDPVNPLQGFIDQKIKVTTRCAKPTDPRCIPSMVLGIRPLRNVYWGMP